jgi:hypothetical protein
VASPFPLPDALRALVASLLAKSPQDRPRSAAAAREALAGIELALAGSPVAVPGPPVRLQPPPRVGPEPIVPAELRERASRLGSRPARTGLSAGQVTLLVALAVAVVVAVAWLPRWAQEPAAPGPTPAAATAAPTPADPPAVAAPPAEAPPAPLFADPPAEPPPTRPRPSVTASSEDPPPVPDVPAPVPTPDRQAEAAALLGHRDAARGLEEKEEWAAALAEYQAALAVDPHVTFALEGRARAAGRVALSDGLDFHGRNASRLSTEAVAREAEALLERAREVPAPGPRLRAQVAVLEAALAGARTPVAVVLESDGLTEVAVSRVGRLGTLKRRSLELRPGEYTVTGSRRGYRDVRKRLTVSPGATPPTVVVRCEEAL